MQKLLLCLVSLKKISKKQKLWSLLGLIVFQGRGSIYLPTTALDRIFQGIQVCDLLGFAGIYTEHK